MATNTDDIDEVYLVRNCIERTNAPDMAVQSFGSDAILVQYLKQNLDVRQVESHI